MNIFSEKWIADDGKVEKKWFLAEFRKTSTDCFCFEKKIVFEEALREKKVPNCIQCSRIELLNAMKCLKVVSYFCWCCCFSPHSLTHIYLCVLLITRVFGLRLFVYVCLIRFTLNSFCLVYFTLGGMKQSKLSYAPYLGKLHTFAINDFHLDGNYDLVQILSTLWKRTWFMWLQTMTNMELFSIFDSMKFLLFYVSLIV